MAPGPIPMSAVKPVDPACFSHPQVRCFHRSRRRHVPNPKVRPMHSTPQRKNLHFNSTVPWPFSGPFLAPRRAPNFGQTSPSPAAPKAGGVVNSEPFWERPAGTPNTLAPNRLKARQLRYARQALVRVPESNTKYGGRRGKTGADHPPVMAASISESSGIPKGKKS
jgi:hypothetical protein